NNGKLNIVKILLDHGDIIDRKGNYSRTPLHVAALSGNENIVDFLLERNASLNIKDTYNYTPIHLAVSSGKFKVVKTLLDHGDSVNSNGNEDRTPLHVAALYGYENIVDFLLERNASLNIKDIHNDAPIHLAVLAGKFKVVKTLLDHGDSVDRKGNFSKTPLHLAAWYGYEDIVDLLLERNASLHKRDKYNKAPIHFAASSGEFNVVKTLLDHGAMINTPGQIGKTPLHYAAENGWETVVDLLLKRNATIDIRDVYDNAPIHYATLNDKLNVVKVLLKHGAAIDSEGNYGQTPLHFAVLHGYENIADFLLSNNAFVNARNMGNDTAIHYAAVGGRPNLVTLLLDHGATPNILGEFDQTPLHIAAMKGYRNILNLLLERNANVDIKDTYHDAAIHHAIRSKDIEMVIQLLQHGANANMKGAAGNTPLILAVNNDTKIIKTLIERGADVNTQNLFGKTALHEAIEKGYVDAVVYLLSQNASVGIQDSICYTPLQRAADNLNINVIKTLLDYEDDINRRGYYEDDINRRGCNNITALHLAVERNNTKLTQFLLSKNADPNVMSEEGKTPLDVAYLKSSDELIKLLLENGGKVEDKSFLGSKILFNAVSKNLLKLVKVLLNRTDHFESYPTVILNYAIGKGFLEGVELLVKYGANIEKKDVHGNLPLSSAVMTKNVEMGKLILQTSRRKITSANFTMFIDADSDVKFINSKRNRSETHKVAALHIASYHGLTKICEMLISYGASLEVRDERGYTPLHYSCEEEHIDVVKSLLDSGASKDSTDIDGTTPLHIASRLGSLSIVHLLLSEPPAGLEFITNHGYTALHYAAWNGSLEIVNLLLNLGANTEAKTNDFKSPLHFASLGGHKEIVNTLVSGGANIEAADIDGMTSMHFAARERHTGVVQLLLDFVIGTFRRNKNGSTPLHLVCERHDKSTRSEIAIVSMLAAIWGGSCISPLLCLVMNSLLRRLNAGIFAQAFADDGVILISGKFVSTIMETMQVACNEVQTWCAKMKLSVNPTKTELILFTRKWKLGLTQDKYTELKVFIAKNEIDIFAIAEAGKSTEDMQYYYQLPGYKVINTKLSKLRQITVDNKRLIFYFIYNPPKNKCDLSWLENLWDNQTLVMGDFNAHSPRWGYKSADTKGNIVENFIGSGPVVYIENADKEPTFFANNGQQTHPDLVLSHPRLENKLSLKLYQAPGSSGHSILLLEVKEDKLYKKQREPCFPRWNFKKAKWEDYQRQSDVEITEQLLNGSIDHICKQLKDQILKCAIKYIPRGKIKIPLFGRMSLKR
ncbi:serine/threonine-protein phosphatase 6 regulatory ankyrin repeat subunit A-like, partial [Halyomorpha halys]|uniref:serine/threonine-protein phosphatase 6 regulatory ankyrin repeat subunit A-like n=1 Tax=Halyomorpha halys TaxID=286706 RepID=UPI0006D4DC1E